MDDQHIKFDTIDGGKTWSLDTNLQAEQVIGYLYILIERIRMNSCQYIILNLRQFPTPNPHITLHAYINITSETRLINRVKDFMIENEKYRKIERINKLFEILTYPIDNLTDNDYKILSQIRGMGKKSICVLKEHIVNYLKFCK